MSMGYGSDEVNDMIILRDNREQQDKNKGWWRKIGYHDIHKDSIIWCFSLKSLKFWVYFMFIRLLWHVNVMQCKWCLKQSCSL
jgi:hypothetical protein